MDELFDAHNHLHDARLDPFREQSLANLQSQGLRHAMVNGTCEDDWPQVAALAAREKCVIPSFGLHPWKVPHRSSVWKTTLLDFLARHPAAGVGEIGLDRWIKDHDLPQQLECFLFQLDIAARENRPASIHCIQAWGALLDSLETASLPPRGFLIHAYGGPLEMVPAFVKLGAYFSFSPYFLHERKLAQRIAFSAMPVERLLVETDAPDLAPPGSMNPYPLPGGLNHPANLCGTYRALAELRRMPLPELTAQVAENFRRWTAE